MKRFDITNVIVHIVDNTHEAAILSAKELEVDKELKDFTEKHLQKILLDSNTKQAFFRNKKTNDIYNSLQEYLGNRQSFIEMSQEITNKFFSILKANVTVPSGDLLFVLFESGSERFLAILKFNYKTSFIHYIINNPEGSYIKIIKHKTTLPNDSQKIEECVLVNLKTLELNILEKSFEIDGKRGFYLSTNLLDCNTDLSQTEKLKILDKTMVKVGKKYLEDDFNAVTKLKQFISESIEEANEVEIETLAEVVFENQPDIKREYLTEVKKAGLTEDVIKVQVSEKSKNYKNQRLKTDNGIEINFPSGVYNNKDVIEFINNPDGTISILIKNINKLTTK